MLRKRVVVALTFSDGVLFRTKLFEPDYRYTLNFVDAWSIDEIVILDVTRPQSGSRENFYKVVSDFSERCFVPVAAGGGIRDAAEADRLLRIGADKVVVNTGALDRPALIEEIAQKYGRQCVVASIDARPSASGYRVYKNFARDETDWDVESWAKHVETLGAGEILITAVERDGSLQGYDLNLCRRVTEAVTVPVLVLGGCGNWQHMVDALAQGAAAACTQNIYHFTENSIQSAKKFLAHAGIPVRQ